MLSDMKTYFYKNSKKIKFRSFLNCVYHITEWW